MIILTHCPVGLRGLLTRWLLEISPGVFIGGPTARVRQSLWQEVQQHSGNGRALMVYNTNNEQGFTFETHDHKWQPVDHEGLTLIRRPNEQIPAASSVPARGWSNASKRRRFGRR